MSSETSTISAPRTLAGVHRPFGECAVWRYYDPATGQFLSVDSLVDATGRAYAYGNDEPVITTDPMGLCAGTAVSPRGLASADSSRRPAPGKPPGHAYEPGVYVDIVGLGTVVTATDRLMTSEALDLIYPTFSSNVANRIVSSALSAVEKAVLGGADSPVYRALNLLQTQTDIAIAFAARQFRENNPHGRQAVRAGAPIWTTVVWALGPVNEGGGKGFGEVKTPGVWIYSYPW